MEFVYLLLSLVHVTVAVALTLQVVCGLQHVTVQRAKHF
jgi:hypothetical protein